MDTRIEELNKYRKEKKMTYEQIAQESSISISTIKDIFRGKTESPRLSTIRAIEKVLGIKEEPAAEPASSNLITEERLVDLGFSKEKIEKLSEQDLVKIRAYIQGLLDAKK